jgi:hypothetical protein
MQPNRLCLVIVFLLTTAGLAKAQPSPGPATAGRAIPTVSEIIQVLQLVDEITRSTSGLDLRPEPGSERTSFYLGAKRTITFTMGASSSSSVPGRDITARIQADIDLCYRMDFKDAQLEKDEDDPTAFTLLISRPVLYVALYPEGKAASYEVEYGWLTNQYFSSDEARKLRDLMYAQALKDIKQKYQKDDVE